MSMKKNVFMQDKAAARLEIIEASDVIRQTGLHGVFFRKYCEFEVVLYQHGLRFALNQEKINFFLNVLLADDIFGALITFVCLYWFVLEGKITLGDQIALVMMGSMIGNAFVSLAQILPSLKEQLTNLTNAHNLLEAPGEPKFLPKVEKEGQPKVVVGFDYVIFAIRQWQTSRAEVRKNTCTSELDVEPDLALEMLECRGCSLGYPGRIPVLQDFNMAVDESSQHTCLVGRSGCGKSTVLKGICGIIKPLAGEICHRGINIENLIPVWQRKLVSVVGQEPYLFRGTVLENIANFDDSMLESAILEAAKQADIHDDIIKLPNGLHTMLGGQSSLSGGQKQRIVIARSIAKQAVLMLLDEATSALDIHSKTKVESAIKRAGNGRYVIEITHNLHAAAGAHKIVVLNSGKLVESGSHDELLQLEGGQYAKLWEVLRSFTMDALNPRVTPAMLRTCYVFQQIDMQVLELFCEDCEIKNHNIGDTIIVEGTIGSSMHIIVDGSVVVKKYSAKFAEFHEIAKLQQGDYFGELALLQSGQNKRMASVEAVTDVQIIHISYEAYQRHVHGTAAGNRISVIAEKRLSALDDVK